MQSLYLGGKKRKYTINLKLQCFSRRSLDLLQRTKCLIAFSGLGRFQTVSCILYKGMEVIGYLQ